MVMTCDKLPCFQIINKFPAEEKLFTGAIVNLWQRKIDCFFPVDYYYMCTNLNCDWLTNSLLTVAKILSK